MADWVQLSGYISVMGCHSQFDWIDPQMDGRPSEHRMLMAELAWVQWSVISLVIKWNSVGTTVRIQQIR